MSISVAPASPPVSVPLPIRILRELKPLVLAILRSPLHWMLSRDVLAMSYRGRRSGSLYTLPLSYVAKTDSPSNSAGAKTLYLCTRPAESQWWRNLQGGAAVELLLKGKVTQAKAWILDASSREALEGLRLFLQRNPRTGELLYEVARTKQGPDETDLDTQVLRSVVVKLEIEVGLAEDGSV